MYEPKYLPPLKDDYISLNKFRFTITHTSKFTYLQDPETEPLHLHNCLEIFINVSSDVSFLNNNNLFFVPKGDVFISRPNDIHMAIFNTPNLQEFICIWVDADSQSPLMDFWQKENFYPLFTFDAQQKNELNNLAFKLLDVFNVDRLKLEQISLLFQILTMFQEKQANHTNQTVVPEALQRILDDINKNFSTLHSVNDILKTHFVSSATLTRWFRKYLHTTPREYLESVRLSHAALLLSNGASVTEACFQSGFSDCSHFIVLFKKKFNTTPHKYKKS